MTTDNQITEIRVYWDTRDRVNKGWAYAAIGANGLIDSGSVDGIADDDLDGAIDEAIRLLDVGVRCDDFARAPHVDGGYGIWSAYAR